MDTQVNINGNTRGIICIRIIFGTLFIISFFIHDAYSIIPLLGGYALYKLFCSFDKKGDIYHKKISKGKVETVYFLFIIGLEIFFSYLFRFLFQKYYSYGSFSVGEFNIIPTFIFWVELGSVLVYYGLIRKERIHFVNKRSLLFSSLLLLPFIYSTVLSLLPYIVKGTESIDLSFFDCINSFYRAFILAGFIEELFYRGLVYDGLRSRLPHTSAIIIQAAFFSLIHSRQMVSLFQTGDLNIVINLICVFLLGIVSAKIRDMTNSFLPSIIFHGCLNGGIYYLGLSIIVY